VDNIKMDLGEIGWGGCGLDSSASGQGVPVDGSYEHGNEPLGPIKCWKFLNGCTTGGLYREELSYEKFRICRFLETYPK
jgi:hypothetical protein